MESILRQSSWLLIAQLLGRIIGFFYTIFLARNLGVENFGLYSVALAYFSIFAQIADFGFNRYLIREVASGRKNTTELLSCITFLRLTLTSISFGLLAVVLYLLDPDKMRVYLILLATLAILPQVVNQTLDAIFVALKKLQYSAVALISLNVITALIGVYLVSCGFGVIGALSALIFGQLVYLVILFVFLRLQKISIIAKAEWFEIKEILKQSLPYGLLGIIGFISFRIDTIILAHFRSNFETGIYNAAFKLLEITTFIPVALTTALFPVFSRFHETDLNELKNIYFKSLKLLFFVSMLVYLFFILAVPIFIHNFLPSYINSIEALRILSLAIPFIFLHIPTAQVILSTDKYLKNSLIMFLGLMSINIALYLVFIPMYGSIGASWVSVFSEVATLTVFMGFLKIKVFKNI